MSMITDIIWYFVYFACAVYAYYACICIRDCYWLRNFKGPLALPIVGNLYTLEALSTIKFLSNLKKRYGRFFTFFMFSRPYIVVCDPELVNRIFLDISKFPKGEDYKVFAIPFGNGLVTSGEERHKKDKSLFSTILSTRKCY
jgi:hypothetical protein